MDHSTIPQLSIPPRVRVSRNAYVNSDASTTPTAGPSRLSPKNPYLSAAGALDEGELEDMDATPRISARARLPSPSTATPSMQLNLTEDTPAGRLRAILARVPNSSASQLLHEPAPQTPSALDSDFDDPPPKWNTTAASIARESLKDLFSNARRDDTPEKRGRRRNSIDASEVEDSPRVDKVAQERAKNKGKRKSLSDEELEKSSKASFSRAGSSHAMNIEALRSRLTNYANGHSSADAQSEQDSVSDKSDGAADASNDTATFLRQLNSSAASPPDATSTPMRSLQFPSQYQNDSNLLDGDSEMQRAMGALDSFDGDSVQQGRPPSFPPPRQKASILGGRSLASLTHTKSLSDVIGNGSSRTARDVSRRASVDSDSISSQTGPSLSASNLRAHEKDQLQSNRSSAEPPAEVEPSPLDVAHTTITRAVAPPITQPFADTNAEHTRDAATLDAGGVVDSEWFRARAQSLSLVSTASVSLAISAPAACVSAVNTPSLAGAYTRQLAHPAAVQHNTEDQREGETAQLPPLEFDDSSPERPSVSASTSSSRKNASVNGHDHSSPPSRIPVPSPGKAKLNGVGATGFRKGHKRTVTEFSEANGAIPPRIKVEAESEPETEPETEPVSQAGVRRETSDNGDTDMIFESDVDDHASFPPVKAVVIPPIEDSDASITITPPFPPAEPADELSESQEVVDTPAIEPLSSTPPISPPSTSSVFPLTTPPRRPFSTPKIEFPTPSPPKNLPDLPIPSSEDEGGEDDDHTPVLDRGTNLDFSSMKTPRPPGAWLATPAQARHTSSAPPEPAPAPQNAGKPRSRSRSNSLPQTPAAEPNAQAQPAEGSTDVRTPGPSALTRAHTLPSRTPAPPGAWQSTPGSTLRRKSLMKVRFDVTSDSAPSEVGDSTISPPPPPSAPQVNGTERPVPPLPAADASVSEPSFEGVAESSPVQQSTPTEANKAPETPKTPAHHSSSRRRPKRSPSIRLLDEYGRECIDTPKKDVSMSMHMPGGTLMTPRNKSTVRMLDAMGREVEEPSEQNDSEDTVTEVSMRRSEALARVKKAVAELHDGINEVNNSEDARFDDKRISDLHDVSRSAREARTKITKSLKEAQANQAKLRSNYERESTQNSRLLPNILPSRRFWSPGMFWSLCAVQFVLFLFMYRIAQHQAKHQFLTTYYDPFYAELYLQPTKPQTFHDPGLFASLLRRPAQPSDAGAWTTFVVFWHGLLDTFARWQRLLWDSWGLSNDELVQAIGSWPPT
ncbi:hypothetical protein EWM64_g2393 [Hericium alpestre]|uniref:Uncharacterized protein n=1 Tax=Hericium alpestre TaxID=135208 RepID=A0A4Z0A7L7_9AGAM|nr:hypothetical protein EWM64_g2393 [Hericium alpestre]